MTPRLDFFQAVQHHISQALPPVVELPHQIYHLKCATMPDGSGLQPVDCDRRVNPSFEQLIEQINIYIYIYIFGKAKILYDGCIYNYHVCGSQK